MKTTTLINDDESLVGALSRFGHSIHTYDDGYGPLFIHRDSMGISGIVRAQTWEDAYEICEDEFFPEATETIEELQKEYGFRLEHIKIVKTASGEERPVCDSDYPICDPNNPDYHGIQFARWETRKTPDPEAWSENELFQEAFGFRPNGPNGKDKLKHGIYYKDLNGDSLELLTPDLISQLEITLQIEPNE